MFSSVFVHICNVFLQCSFLNCSCSVVFYCMSTGNKVLNYGIFIPLYLDGYWLVKEDIESEGVLGHL